MIDRRHFKRFFIEKTGVRSRMRFSEEVQLVDVSLGGASITLKHPLVKGETYSLRIDSSGQTLSLNGEVVWIERASEIKDDGGKLVPVYKAGICFSKVFTGKGEKLAELIEERSRSLSHRFRVRGVRVKLDTPKAMLDLQDEYMVREISFGGIQVEAARQLAKDMEYRMRMFMPDGDKPVHFLGRIASCRAMNDNEPPGFLIGIEFINMGFKDLARVKDLIYRLEGLDPESPRVINLRTSEPGPNGDQQAV